MDKPSFSALLDEVTLIDRDFALRFVSNPLPESFRYFVRLNQSLDHHLVAGELVFPEDDALYDKLLGPMNAAAAVDLLWREGLIPEWIDISVVQVDLDHTYMELRCCGRYTADESLLYYARRNTGPFGIKSPILPGNWSKGDAPFALPERYEPR